MAEYSKVLCGIYLAQLGLTCTGEAAVRSPATPPPRTRPSGPARDTLSPPVRLR